MQPPLVALLSQCSDKYWKVGLPCPADALKLHNPENLVKRVLNFPDLVTNLWWSGHSDRSSLPSSFSWCLLVKGREYWHTKPVLSHCFQNVMGYLRHDDEDLGCCVLFLRGKVEGSQRPCLFLYWDHLYKDLSIFSWNPGSNEFLTELFWAFSNPSQLWTDGFTHQEGESESQE